MRPKRPPSIPKKQRDRHNLDSLRLVLRQSSRSEVDASNHTVGRRRTSRYGLPKTEKDVLANDLNLLSPLMGAAIHVSQVPPRKANLTILCLEVQITSLVTGLHPKLRKIAESHYTLRRTNWGYGSGVVRATSNSYTSLAVSKGVANGGASNRLNTFSSIWRIDRCTRSTSS